MNRRFADVLKISAKIFNNWEEPADETQVSSRSRSGDQIRQGFLGMIRCHFYVIVMLLLGIAQTNSAEPRVVLVDGNTKYPNAPLATVAGDRDEKSGIYTGAQLRGPALAVEAVFNQTRASNSKLASEQLVPSESSSLIDEFAVGQSVHMTLHVTATGMGESTVEPASLQNTEQANAAGPYLAYLDKSSQSDFFPSARLRVRQLKSAEERLLPFSGQSETRRFKPDPAAQVASGDATPVPVSRRVPEMVVIPAGSFLMGSLKSEEGHHFSEGPQHQVTLARPFRIGKYEVSVAEYRQFVEATKYRTEAERGGGCYYWDGKWKKDTGRAWRSPGFSQSASHPVVCVSWDDAKAYADWLTKVTGGKRYRLPTEAEWEYVARGETTGARYWGENLSDACEYANVHDQTSKRVNAFGWTHHDCDDGRAQTAPVGNYRANGFGLHDVLGNVLEWTSDCWNDTYRGAPSDGSAQESGSCARRVLRGGAWDNIPRVVRAANRGSNPTFYRDIRLGFRLAQDM